MGAAPEPESRRTRIGTIMMGVSWLLWLVLPFVPALPVSGAFRGVTAASILVTSSALFWGGAFLAGAGLARSGVAVRALERVRGLLSRGDPNGAIERVPGP